MSESDLRDEVRRQAEANQVLRRENAVLKARLLAQQPKAGAADRALTLRVAKKTGAVSLYGLRRFPTTLYKSEWLTVLGAADTIRTFLTVNDERLSQGPADERFREKGPRLVERRKAAR